MMPYEQRIGATCENRTRVSSLGSSGIATIRRSQWRSAEKTVSASLLGRLRSAAALRFLAPSIHGFLSRTRPKTEPQSMTTDPLSRRCAALVCPCRTFLAAAARRSCWLRGAELPLQQKGLAVFYQTFLDFGGFERGEAFDAKALDIEGRDHGAV
jgi:hypothetical protein